MRQITFTDFTPWLCKRLTISLLFSLSNLLNDRRSQFSKILFVSMWLSSLVIFFKLFCFCCLFVLCFVWFCLVLFFEVFHIVWWCFFVCVCVFWFCLLLLFCFCFLKLFCLQIAQPFTWLLVYRCFICYKQKQIKCKWATLCVTDIDECQDDNVCTQGHCQNTEGSFICNCEAGFILSSAGDQCNGTKVCDMYSCVCYGRLWLIVFVMLRYSDVFTDVDECLELPQTCDGVGQCVNILGSYQCNCPQGYRQVNGTSCHGETIHQTNSHIQHRGCVWNRMLLYYSYCFCRM